ncbi:Protein THEM6 [Orchesella cincta]|uniref:Protein THEM6 n=1 Tax=Orchesella cincta TaxID=48709 RepID=A0A1D2MUF9_ORCCI|nr:Protein THEM6 [Orchesella cincta]
MEFSTLVISLIVILIVLLVIVYLIDINYFMRTIVVVLYAYFVRKSLSILDQSVVSGRVLPFDADTLLTHMNNARCLREFDFGRLDFLTRCGLVKYIICESPQKQPLYAVAHVIRYRRPLHMFMKYKIVTRAVHWDDQIMYFEHKIVTFKDNMVRCIGYSKAIFPFRIEDFLEKYHPGTEKPELPSDLEIWMNFIRANGLNSKKRNEADTDTEQEVWALG